MKFLVCQYVCYKKQINFIYINSNSYKSGSNPAGAPYKSSTYQKSLATSHLSWVHGRCSKPKGKPRPESLRRGFFMPASSNVCRQFQQGNRVACVAPGKFDPLAIGQARWDFPHFPHWWL